MRNALAPFALSFVVLSGGCGRDKPSPLRALATASTEEAEMAHPIPILNVRDLRASQAYFRDELGFKVDWEHGDPPDFGAVTRGEATMFLCQGCQGRGGAWMMIFTRDVDGLYREIAGKKAIVRMPPRTMPWKLREMHVADPDGNVIRFASNTEH